MGYHPTGYDRQSRMLFFRDDEEVLVVRFRHRTGIATNVTYVERIVDVMKQYGATQAFLFCTPGLSGNGAALADRHKIRSHSLETMNEWIEGVLTSQRSGPPGDILKLLEELVGFLGQISAPLPSRRF